MADPDQFLRDFHALYQYFVGNFIADAPQCDAGMIAVAPDQITQILFVAGIEFVVIIAWCLLRAPHVERFVHDQKTHFIAQIQQFRIGRIVRHAQGVAAECFDFPQPPGHDFLVECRPEHAQIMVHAETPEPVRFAVQFHSPVGIKGQFPESVRQSDFVFSAPDRDFIQRRMFRAPQFDPGQMQFRAAG